MVVKMICTLFDDAQTKLAAFECGNKWDAMVTDPRNLCGKKTEGIEDFLQFGKKYDISISIQEITLPRIWADFNNVALEGIRLNTVGTLQDLCTQGIKLDVGLLLELFDEDLTQKVRVIYSNDEWLGEEIK